MIFVDPRVGSKELAPYIRKRGISVELCPLEFADVYLEGKGPKGTIYIGIERKTVPDMLQCIDDARYAGHQRPGMNATYDHSLLLVEGVWAIGSPPFMDGTLITSKGGSWFPLRYRSRNVMYSKLYRYLLTVSLSGVTVTFSRDIFHSAANICETYWYFQKKWEDHTSLQEIHQLAIPQIVGRPSLVRRWASQLDGIGVKFSLEAERVFRRAGDMANSVEEDWLRIPGVGIKTAQQIVRGIWKRG